jgi:succinate dehydrogenase hydrophobic anchor subunit
MRRTAAWAAFALCPLIVVVCVSLFAGTLDASLAQHVEVGSTIAGFSRRYGFLAAALTVLVHGLVFVAMVVTSTRRPERLWLWLVCLVLLWPLAFPVYWWFLPRDLA